MVRAAAAARFFTRAPFGHLGRELSAEAERCCVVVRAEYGGQPACLMIAVWCSNERKQVLNLLRPVPAGHQ
jgi:hypothetical protein